MADRYGVVGHPVSHSRSPFIHARFAEQTGEDIVYEAIHVQPGEFVRAVDSFRQAGGRGLNVTVPFKREAWEWAAARSARAELAGAVNTLCFEAGADSLGDNTDGIGLIRDLRRLGVELRGAHVLLIGAGGAARGAIGAILECGPRALTIANRTAERAVELVEAFSPVRGRTALTHARLDRLDGLAPEVMINATSASLAGRSVPLPDSLAAGCRCAYDMVYAAAPTAFVGWARAHGADLASDGLGMLVEQAAESFYLWRGTRPEVAPVLQSLGGRLA